MRTSAPEDHRMIRLRTQAALAALLMTGAAQGETLGAYIVEGSSTAQARTAVMNAGGTVTGELNLIDGVSASLSALQVAHLREQPYVRGVFADAKVKVSATSTAQSATSTVADSFSTVAYT